jgi:hypothetical protein
MQIDDPALEVGEWLFKRGGQVYGPVSGKRLAEMLYKGDLETGALVSSGDGTWRGLSEIPAFLVHVRKAEAALRVEREVTGARQLRLRKRRRATVSAVVVLLVATGGAGYGAWSYAQRQGATNPLLEDFGSGIRIAVAARIGTGRRAADDEVAVQIESFDAPRSAARRQAAGAPHAGTAAGGASAAGAARGLAEGGDLVAAQYDPARIQAVIAREQRTLAPCFKAEADRSPDFSGDIPLEFAVGNDGKVAQLWIDDPRFKAGPLRDCLLQKLSGWRFDPFPGQRPTVALAFRIGR